jgi:alpha-L-fucosidase
MVQYWDGKDYKLLDEQTTIGHKRILAFPTITSSRIKITITEPKAAPVLSEIGIYKAPPLP